MVSRLTHRVLMLGLALSLLLLYSKCSRCTSEQPIPILIHKPSECRTSSVFRCGHCIPDPLLRSDTEKVISEYWTFNTDVDAQNFALTNHQCDVAFPGLFEEISQSVQRRKTAKRLITKDEIAPGSAHPLPGYRVMIYDSELYVVDAPATETHRIRLEATLQAIHRAIVSSPEKLPNVEFALSVDDFADASLTLWSYTRTADDQDTWLMPDFGFWSWGELGVPASLGSWKQVQRRMREVEERYPSFSRKTPKLFWRGEAILAANLRNKLLEETDRKPWADIKDTSLWIGGSKDKSRKDAVPIHEYCRYQFLMHTEGVSYSGRLKYLQSCRSVVFAHTLQWIQHFQYLMVSSGPKQNYVEVKRDFSDLAAKVEYYLAHPDEAERIANNSITTFRDRYLTPAAETCYWRKLIRGWREVSFEPEFYASQIKSSVMFGGRRWRGTPFENYSLRRELDRFV